LAIGSANWADNVHQWQHLGEVRGAPRPWKDGARPWMADLGQPAGKLEYFKNGAPISAAGEMPVDSLGAPVSCNAWADSMDINSYRHYTTGSLKRLYPAGMVTGTSDSYIVDQDKIYFSAWINVRPVKINQMAIFSRVGSTSPLTRLGIYESASATDLFPKKLIWDSGPMSIFVSSFTWVYKDCGVTLKANTLYWFAWFSGDPLGEVVGRSRSFYYPIMGYNDSFFEPCATLTALQTFGPLPDPAPAVTFYTFPCPVICATVEAP